MNNDSDYAEYQDGYTGASDEHYNLISALYHALEGAETHQYYIEDAEEAGDDELAEFFRDVQAAYREQAQRAKQLLAARLANV
jgi:uncharacterized protein YaaW (UPF0174 family)